jgi:3-phosphoshikimate 1-carboxyvinyltransferase
MQIASAQVKSCLLLAGMYAKGRTRVCEPAPCRDHTERMLQGFAWPVNLENNCASLEGGASLQATTIDVPSDISSAAFFMVAASIAPGSDILLRHVGINPTRTGILALLKQMGGDIQLLDEREVGGEPVADIRVRYSPLKGIVIPEEQIPLAIDEFPVLFVAAACAEGETVLRGAEELRVKESDRIEAMAVGLKTLGVELETYPDGIRIVGGKLGAGEIDSQGDHRIAMAFAVAALRASGPIRIADCANVATSFPGFVELANQAGLQVSQQQEKSP